ncbi:MAG: hypothetical protein Q9203_007101, partial [Teloschistes exilis]
GSLFPSDFGGSEVSDPGEGSDDDEDWFGTPVQQQGQEQAQPSQEEQDDTNQAGGQNRNDDSSADGESDVPEAILRADQEKTREEFRQSLNPFERELYDYFGEPDEERKRKRDDGEGDDEDEPRPRKKTIHSPDPDISDSQETDSMMEDQPARGSTSPPPPPPPGASSGGDSASSSPTKDVKASLRDLSPTSAGKREKPMRYSVNATSLDPNWQAKDLPQPEEWDVPDGTRTRGRVTLRDQYRGYIKAWGWRMLEFVRSDHGYESGWIGVKPLGEGSFGRAGLWEKRDEDGKVVDQVCIKQLKKIKDGNVSPEDFEKPFEVDIMEDIGQWKNVNIIQLRGYRRYPKSRAHRLYLEYCKHGDLGRLITKYRKRKRYIPEEFIWEVFYHMTMACRTLALGPQPKSDIYTVYVHRDIKPENSESIHNRPSSINLFAVFLASPMSYDDDGIPFYPTAKMGDFGGADSTGKYDPANPMQLKGMGTIGYRAPVSTIPIHNSSDINAHLLAFKEQKWPADYDREGEWSQPEITQHWPQLGSHTNIWEVGACMYKLMKLTDAEYKFWKKLNRHGNIMKKIETKRKPEDYSEELRQLVYECLMFDPIKRPNVFDLQKRVERGRDKFRDAWWKGEPVDENAKVIFANDELEQMNFGDWRHTDSKVMTSGKPEKTYQRTGEIPFHYSRKSASRIPSSENHD